MCQFCVQHGAGQKWYLAMANYSRELLEQDNRRAYMAAFINDFEIDAPTGLARVEWLSRTPFMPVARQYLQHYYRRHHFGQVVPLEEIEQILNQMARVARLPCACRRVTLGQPEVRYCFALTADAQLAAMLDDSYSLEYLTPAEARQAIWNLDCQGLIHTVWTFKTPYIGAICNCDQDCIAYRMCHARQHFQLMFRAEYVAEVNPAHCTGCRLCMRQCQFGALRYSAANKQVSIDPRQCYGCGVCRAACHHNAITLRPRATHPIAAHLW